ncbi:hypothetical protein [Corallococcus sp. AS-1-6]|uniref:hypothetical protein n=1 Tax=Corallococcus sp. AS-1-6 TaxID=2874599 RepID=UPI001CBCA366|nr:hypothetical protein [Corallococcus sp. AS-1-6]MBZ4373459.1 hypothetical protein [Corallococcus sp. AS-1-6]
MEKSIRARGKRPGAAQPSGYERDLAPLMKTIDDAVAGIRDEKQRMSVREAVGEAVHGAIQHLSTRQPRSPPSTLATPALDSGVAALKQVQNLGFVEFTAGLITGTFDAIVGATIKQMKAYAELVADLAKTLAEFQEEHVTTAQVNAHLSQRYGDGLGGTSCRTGYTFKDTAADAATGAPATTAHENLMQVVTALLEETKDNKVPLQFVSPNEVSSSATSFTTAQVDLIRAAIAEMLAIKMITHLRAMARDGMARIVVSNGEILSRLTFTVTSTDAQTVQRNRYDQSNFSANVSGRVGFGGWFRTSFGASYSNLQVSSVNESSFDAVTMNAEIIGQVRIQFRTETFAPIVVDDPIN